MADSPALTLREARGHYFERSGFPSDGGYSARWVRLDFGPIPFAFPNLESRRRAVRFHDLHHVLTGYDTDWAGEAEISAWEIASDCADFYAAWFLNLGGILIGLVVAPGRTYRAFVRGCHSRNLYGTAAYEPLLERSVGDMRTDLGLGEPAPEATRPDRLRFAGWCGAAILHGAAITVVSWAPIVLIGRWLLT